MTADKIMAAPVVGFNAITSVAKIMEVLRGTSHNGFPVFSLQGLEPEGGSHAWQAGSGTSPGHSRGGTEGGHPPSVGDAAAATGLAKAAPRDAAELYESEGQAGLGTELKEGLASALAAGSIGGVVSAAAAAAAAGLSGVTGMVAGGSPSKTGKSGEVVQILDGLILRSQLLVLLQRRHFCDSQGRPIGREYCEKKEIELEVRRISKFNGVAAVEWESKRTL